MKERKWIQYLNIWYSVLILQLNPDVNVFQRKFVNEVRRCEEMDRKLRMCILVLSDVRLVTYLFMELLFLYDENI